MIPVGGEMSGSRIRVGSVTEFRDGDRKLVPIGSGEIGVFRVDGRFVAYLNRCLHQGGPVCEGRFFPRMTARVTDRGLVQGERFDRSEPHLVCPWHGWEYDLRTGKFCGDQTRSLHTYPVEVHGDDVYVLVS